MHACNLHCSSTCGGTSKQTNSHLTLAVVELNPTESPPMLRPKTNLFQVGREKSKDFLSLFFGKKSPLFGEKSGEFVFLPFQKTERSSLFLLFSLFFPTIHAFFGQSPLFSQKAGKGGSGKAEVESWRYLPKFNKHATLFHTICGLSCMSHDLEGVQTLVSQIFSSDRERETELYVALCAEHCHQLHALNPRQHANATFKWEKTPTLCQSRTYTGTP